jgi:small subunit ribosomal protein S1
MSEMTEKQENATVETQPQPVEQTQQPLTEAPVASQTPVKKTVVQSDEFEDLDRIIKVDSLGPEEAYSSEEFAELSKLYEKSLREIQEGELVKGRIVAITEKEIAVDIGFKAEGVIPIDEFPEIDTLHIGDEITVFLDKVEDQEGQLVLSKRKADFMATWERMVRHYETQDVIIGKITRRIKGGMVVDLNGIDAFLPGSQIDIHPVRDFDALVGHDMEFRIVKINELRKNIVLSHKVLIEESLAEVREKILLDMEIGQVMEGTVKNITDFGVFVDLGGVDGLLHITDLSWGRISHPSEVVALDDKNTVKIIDFDPIRKRVSIGYKQLLPHPWEGVETRYPIGAKVTGKVVSITNYGAFIELEKGVEGLIHVSEMSWTQHIKHPSAMLSIGDEIEAVVLNMDVAERKISLGMKQIEPDPWEALESKYTVGSRHMGAVRELVPFGAFIELEDGIEGLVHISDLSWTKKVHHPGEIVKKGDAIEVIILGFDRNERRIALGYKQIMESPWEKFSIDYAVGIATTGRVVRLIDKGVIVELPDGVEGFVPNSQLGKDEEGSIRKRLNAGDTLELNVVEFEKEAKRIVLSALEARKRKEKEDHEEYLKAQAEAAAEEVPPIPEVTPSAEETPADESSDDAKNKSDKPKRKPKPKPADSTESQPEEPAKEDDPVEETPSPEPEAKPEEKAE